MINSSELIIDRDIYQNFTVKEKVEHLEKMIQYYTEQRQTLLIKRLKELAIEEIERLKDSL